MIPNILKKGDKIGVVATSEPILERNMQDMENSKKMLEDAGLIVEYGKNMCSNKLGYGATPEEKTEDLHYMFKNEDIKAIFCAKGGLNSNAMFEYVDYELIKNNPKIICGFSDSTSILNIITQKTGLVTFHGPTFKSLSTWETDYSLKEVTKRFIKGSLELGQEDDEYITIKEGVAEGKLIGGNLNLIRNMMFGKYSIDFTDKILFIEDWADESLPGMVSNYFYFMKQNGVFDKIKGIWLGSYESQDNISFGKILLDTIKDEYNFPIIKSNNFGHTERKTVIPIGTNAKIDTNKKVKIRLLEDCVKI